MNNVIQYSLLTFNGLSLLAVSMTRNTTASGVWPGVCRTLTEYLDESLIICKHYYQLVKNKRQLSYRTSKLCTAPNSCCY